MYTSLFFIEFDLAYYCMLTINMVYYTLGQNTLHWQFLTMNLILSHAEQLRIMLY